MFKFIAALFAIPFLFIAALIGLVTKIVMLPFQILGSVVAVVMAPLVFIGLVRKTKSNHKAQVRAFVDSVLAKHNVGYDVSVDISWETDFKPVFYVKHARYAVEAAESVAQEIRRNFPTSKVI